MPNFTHSDCSPARQYSQVWSLIPGLMMTRVADLDACWRHRRQVTDGVDDSRRVGAEDPRRHDLHAGHSAEDEQIQVVQRRGVDADAHLSALRLGLRQIGAVLELIESAVRRDGESSHANIGRLYSVVATIERHALNLRADSAE